MSTTDGGERLTSYKILKQLKVHPDWQTILGRIVSGGDLAGVATYILQDLRWNCPDVKSPAQLERALLTYRNLIATNAAPPQQGSTTAAPPELVVDPRNIDPLSELGWLWMEQKSRIDREFKLEASMGKLFPTTVREVVAATKILESMMQMRMDAGLLPNQRAIGSAGDEGAIGLSAVESEHGGAVARVLENPHARQKVLGLAARLDGIIKRSKAARPPATSTIDVTASSKE